jgi:transcription antitermination factor NusG
MTLTLYRTLPQAEQRAIDECRRAGLKAYAVPVGTRWIKRTRYANQRTPKTVIAAGYVVAHGKPPEAHHVRLPIGPVAMTEILGLCRSVKAERRRVSEFVGARVKIRRGSYADVEATVTDEKGSILHVELALFGRKMKTTVHKTHVERL